MVDALQMLIEPTLETVYMTLVSAIFALILGFPFGALLCVTSEGNLTPNAAVNNALGRIVNALRSFPFIILVILVFPLSRLIVGTSIGASAAIVPLSVAAAPFVARVVESALKETSPDLILAAKAMGSTNAQIIFKVIIPEAYPALASGIALTIINIVGYSAMAGAIGGGGLGDLAIRYGYQRFRADVMLGAVAVIVVMVELIQYLGDKVVDHIMEKRGLR
ncbi:MAG: ABC transporter permease [Holosporaceae bacterium]|jgi:D-methionine transport system permease protein|nr:ABC transporter permease [Holosporaceae bacterium]